MTKKLKPVIKWAGGKRRLLRQIVPLFPREFSGYAEPFFGGGAVYFALDLGTDIPRHLADTNFPLMNMYRAIRDNPEMVCENLDRFIVSETAYYAARDEYNRLAKTRDASPVRLAALLIYLNKTGYNGLYRVNASGEYNVPWGHNNYRRLYDEEVVASVSKALQGALLLDWSFETTLVTAESGWFVYCDPPYATPDDGQGFTRYTRAGFARADHERLAECLKEADARGVMWALSNNDVPWVRELYAGYNFHVVRASRPINRDPKGRGRVAELLITNLESDDDS